MPKSEDAASASSSLSSSEAAVSSPSVVPREEIGSSQLPSPPTRPSPIPNSVESTQSYPTVVGPAVRSPLPQRPKQFNENLVHRQRSTYVLGKHREAAGRHSAAAEDSESNGNFPQPEPMTIDEVPTIYAELIMVEKCIEAHHEFFMAS